MSRIALLSLAIPLLAAPSLVRADEVRTYEVKKTEPKLAAGAKGKAGLTISGKNGWHLNAEAPITVSVAPGAGLSVEKQKLTRGDLVESTKDIARFEIPVAAGETGPKTLKAEARFVMCQETACRPVKETVDYTIDVAPPAPPPTAAKVGKGKRKANP